MTLVDVSAVLAADHLRMLHKLLDLAFVKVIGWIVRVEAACTLRTLYNTGTADQNYRDELIGQAGRVAVAIVAEFSLSRAAASVVAQRL